MGWGVARTVGLLTVILAASLAHDTLARLDTTDLTNEVTVVIEVLNGCGRGGVGEKICQYLASKGFDVMFVGNADDFQYERTLVVDRQGDHTKALAIAELLGVGTVITQVNPSSFVETTLILGKDVAGIAPWLNR
ncbi:MAG TPA: LytR C-terminal domain-containing protein [bacterium]|nr:LytR C-terminal domain-containing protein [bacterium]